MKSISESATNPTISTSADFRKNTALQATEYFSDANGNRTKDLNKGISNIEYNSLNLLSSLTISNSLGSTTNTYTYAADGRKLSVTKGNHKTDYVGNIIYENGALKRILTENGYIENRIYYFYIKDHLGNNRIVTNQNGDIVQNTQYYPFGMAFADGIGESAQPYKYNGKELDGERGLNLYDYSARYMDGAIGRFTTVDPLAEKYYSISPYVYCANNPIKYVDPDGKVVRLVNNYVDGMENIAKIAATSLGSQVMSALIGKRERYTMNSTFWASSSSYNPRNRYINYVKNPWYSEIPYDGGALNSMVAMGHETLHAFDHSIGVFNSSNAGYSRNIVEPCAVSFGNYLRNAYSLSPLRGGYGIIQGNFHQFSGNEKISDFATVGNNSDKTSYGFNYTKSTTIVESYKTDFLGLKIPDKTRTETTTYYMIVSRDENNGVSFQKYDSEEEYKRATSNW